MRLSRFKNQKLAFLTSRSPLLANLLSKIHGESLPLPDEEDVPWTPVVKPLDACKVALVTTAGVHHSDHAPFDMNDPEGDPSFRMVETSHPLNELMITHDYYDTSDAKKDINIVFPIQRLQELQMDGLIREVSSTHFGFMGHIMERHLHTLVNESAPEVAGRLKKERVDVVILTPG